MFIADTHADTLYAMGVRHLSGSSLSITPEGLRQGGVSLQVFALWTGPKGKQGNVDEILAAELSQVPVMEAAGIRQVYHPDEAKDGEHCFMLSIEGGEPFEKGEETVAEWYQRGVRMVALVWNNPNRIGYPARGTCEDGLTEYGIRIVKAMQRQGIAVDTSHLNERGFYDIFAKTDKAPMASHSCCKALCGHRRNLTDDQIRLLIREGGYIGVNFYPWFLSDSGEASLGDVVQHIDHVCQLGGSRIVGFGSDFDGIEITPDGLSHSYEIPALIEALKKRGYDQQTIEGIAGENLRAYYHRI